MSESQLRGLQARFLIEAPLGSGNSGLVFKAFDRIRATTVAIKVLERLDADSLFRFKGEFRQLASIAHPNLLQLYEMTAFESTWVLSMELIEGCNLLEYVRPAADPASSGAEAIDDLTQLTVEVAPPANDVVMRGSVPSRSTLPPPHRSSLDVERIRAAFRQLCEGLHALHKTHRLHRDLKPANVLVARADHRVVICDFGLVVKGARSSAPSETLRGQPDTYDDEKIAGTPAYMSPEQMEGSELTTASDWYAVGLMLYQALTGRLPFSPRLPWNALARARREDTPIHPCALDPALPVDLAELALALIAPAPADRPNYAVLVSRLAGTVRKSLAPTGEVGLVGREEQLALLRDALARAGSGSATLAFVSGPSGMGKSALVQTFLDEVRSRRDAVVLAGRCYEREDLPYKAIDPLLDALSSVLMRLTRVVVDDVPGLAQLARLFPVLLRVPRVAEAVAPSSAAYDPAEQKRMAFAALRELCRRLAQGGPLVLAIDDLQWGDLDSAPALMKLLREPHAPGLLMVCAFRSEDEARSPLLKQLREAARGRGDIAESVDVSVDALSLDGARSVARALLQGVPAADQAVELVAAEAAGSPFFVRALAAYVVAHGLASAQQLQLENVIAARLESLFEESRRLLSIIAVAGRPEQRRIIDAVAKLGPRAQLAYRTLEALGLVQSSSTLDRIEPAHDRIRETAYRLLGDAERRSHHAALAAAIEQTAGEEADPDVLLGHHRAAGAHARAAAYALRSAERAESLLAFERAVLRYRQAIELGNAQGAERGRLEVRLAYALMFAGRGPEAADAFFRAVPTVSADEASVLRSLATAQLLRSGCVARAFEELGRAEDLLGMPVPTSPLKALGMLLWRRLRIRLSARLWRRRRGRMTDEQRNRMDFLWGIASAMSPIDQLRGSVYQAEHMLLAQRSGDPYRLARALAVEASTHATANRRPERTQQLLDRALFVGGASREPHALSVALGLSGVCKLLEGRFLESIRLAQKTHVLVSENLEGRFAWDRVANLHFALRAAALTGQVSQVIARVPELLQDAEMRGDLYAAVSLRTSHCCWAWLGPDQPEVARAQVALAEAQWAQTGYHLQHWYTTQAIGTIALYTGDVAEARARLAREWRATFVIRKKVQFTRTEILYLRARLNLAHARSTQQPALLADVRRDANALLREPPPWIVTHGRLLHACADSFTQPERAAAVLYELEGQFEAVDMRLHAAVCALRRGQLLGSAGRPVQERAEREIRALGVTRPQGFANLLAPGFPPWSPESEDEGRNASANR